MLSTKIFKIEEIEEELFKEKFDLIWKSLEEKGYSPIAQISGYILSNDPAYITAYNGARKAAVELGRDLLLETLIKEYLKNRKGDL